VRRVDERARVKQEEVIVRIIAPPLAAREDEHLRAAEDDGGMAGSRGRRRAHRLEALPAERLERELQPPRVIEEPRPVAAANNEE
jgi:hypothetical protein